MKTLTLLFAVLGLTASMAASAAEKAIPAGTMITVTSQNGVDAPINGETRRNPLPILFSLKKDGIGNGCTLLTSGYGDLSTERLTVRAESLTCTDATGSPTTTRIQGYIVGEDGKEGLRGKLVSKRTSGHRVDLVPVIEVSAGRAAPLVLMTSVNVQDTPATTTPYAGQLRQLSISVQLFDGDKNLFASKMTSLDGIEVDVR